MNRRAGQNPTPTPRPCAVAMLLLGNPAGDIRVIKTVRSLQDAGYQVTISYIGPREPVTTPDLHGGTIRRVQAPRPLQALDRLRGRLRRTAHAVDGQVAGPATRERQHSIRRELRALAGTLWLNVVLALQAAPHKEAIVHANDLDTLLAAILMKIRGAGAVVYDAHELYPDMHAGRSALYAGLWRLLEHWLIGHVDAVITVNAAIARELQRRHRLPRLPAVVMNCPSRVDAPSLTSPSPSERPLPLLFHGALHAERGLEELIAALPLLPDAVTLSLRGDGPLRPLLEGLAREVGVADRVRFLPRVPPDRLIAELTGFAIGVVPYPPISLNNYLCSPNKLFEYMMGGLAILASDLPELHRIVTESDVGLLYDTTSHASLAEAVTALFGDRDRLARCQRAARRAAEQIYNWERQAAVLLEVYAGLMRAPA